MHDRGRRMSAILTKKAPGIFLEPFTHLQAIILLIGNLNRTMICAFAFLVLEQMDRRKSESIVVAAMRRLMRSQLCAQLGLRPHFMSDRGLHGPLMHLAP